MGTSMQARLRARALRQAERRLHPAFISAKKSPLLQLARQRFALQLADLVHHHPPDVMTGRIAREPRPLSPDRGIELRLRSMQPDHMLGNTPEIPLFHDDDPPLLPFARARPGLAGIGITLAPSSRSAHWP